MPKVMTRCPESGAIVPTQLDMEAKALAKLRSARAIYCCVCRVGHIVEPDQLWLGSDVAGVHPLAATPWSHRLGGGEAKTRDTMWDQRIDVSGEPILPPATSPGRSKHLTPR